MSKPWRIAVVVEGPTDSLVLKAILRSVLAGADFEFQILQPEGSAAFGTNGAGWGGVYRWSRQAAEERGRFAVWLFSTVPMGPLDDSCGCGRGRQDVCQRRDQLPATE